MGTVENAPRAAADALLAIVRTRAISLVAPRLSKWSKEFNEHRIIALLEDIGNASPEVVPTLVKFLRHEQAAVRRAAAATLGRIGPAADAAIPALRACVSDKKQSLRSEAIIALARIRRDQETLNLLSKDVQDSECETGARLLGDAGREARLALPVLKKQAANPVFALACLRIEPPPVGLGAGREAWDRATAELATVMDRPENFFRSSYRSHGFEVQEQARRIRDAMGALLSRLRKSSSLRQELTAALRDPKVETRLLAAVALAPLKDRPPDLDADIAGMLRKRPYLLCYLADTLTVLGSDNKTVRPWLARYLTHDNPAAYDEAVRLLVKSDPQAIRKIWGPLGISAEQRQRAALRSAAEWADIWALLAAVNPSRSYHAQWEMLLSPAETVRFMEIRLQPAPEARTLPIDRWLGELDSDEFAVREAATKELETVIDIAAPAVRRLLARKPTPEARKRAEHLLHLIGARGSQTQLRSLRAIEVLEHIGTLEARRLLQRLGRGAGAAQQTVAASAALARLGRQSAAK